MIPNSATPEKAPARSQLHFEWVLSHEKLSSSAKVLYTILWHRMAPLGARSIAMHSMELALKIGVKRNRISRLVHELRDAKIIATREQGGGQPLEFTLLSIAALMLATHPSSAHLAGVTGTVYFKILDDDASAEHGSDDSVGDDHNAAPEASTLSTTLVPQTPPIGISYIASPPTREILATEDLVVGDLITAAADRGEQLTIADARRLAEQFGPDRCRRQLDLMPYRPNVKHFLAYLRAAIANDKSAPVRAVADLADRAAERDAAAARNREQDRALEVAASRANDELLDSLPPSVKYALELRADEKLAKLPFQGDARRHVRRGMLVTLAQEYRASGAVA